MTLEDMKGVPGESSKVVADRVHAARRIQAARLGDSTPVPCNAALDDRQLREYCVLENGAQRLLDSAFDKLGLSARAMTRIVKVARTIADLVRRDRIAATDLAEAIQYRTFDRQPRD